MAGEINKDLSKQLAYKIQDPVATGDLNGIRVTGLARLSLLHRAQRKLLRLVEDLDKDLISNILDLGYVVGTSSNAGIVSVDNYYDVYEVFVKPDGVETWTRAEYIEQADWATVITGQSDFYNPDLDGNRFYWGWVNDRIEIMPAVQYDVLLTYIPALLEPTYSTNDINILDVYYDLLLNIAASEFHLDVGDEPRAKIYLDLVKDDILLIKQRKLKDEKTN